MRVTRRGFIQAFGATAGAAALVKGQLSKAEVGVDEFARWATPEETFVASICQQCPGGCGLIARTLDGRLAGIAGNPIHPVNRGALCPKAYGALQFLYDPARLKGPMVRAGDRGRFRSIGWDEALRMVTERLAELRGKGQSHTVAILGGQYRGYRDTLWSRFAEAYGTPNYIRVRCLAPERPALAHRLLQGVTSPLSYDLAGARCILSFGAGFLDAWLSPVHSALAFAGGEGTAERPRARLIHIDPRRSHTATKADRWVPIVPGTDGILALGIANALIREGAHDRDFVQQQTFGFEDWVDPSGQRHEGFKDLVLSDYGLLTVSAATGVPVRTILEIARDIATLKPAVVIGERGPAYGADDLHTRMAIHSLNALVGSIGVPGGVLLQGELPLTRLPAPIGDQAAKRGGGQPRIDGAGQDRYFLVSDASQALPERILAGTPYPINALFLVASNPLANHPAKEAFAKAFDRVPFIVSFSPFLDESSSKADLVLPDHSYLERWQDDQVTHLAGFTCFSVARPATTPLQDTRDAGDVMLQVAQRLGGSVGQSLPWASFEKLLYVGARGLFDAGRGYVASTNPEESLRKVLERQGYWRQEFSSYDEFWKALVERGAWWDPTGLVVSRKALLKTASGKFEFYSTALRRKVEEAAGAPGKDDNRGDRFYLPAVAIPAAEEQREFPFRLNTYRLVTRPMGGGRHQPWLLEQPAVHVHAAWERWCEVHPETAAKLGIKDGDWIQVESKKGRIRLRAKLFAGTLPDIVHIPLFGGEGPNQNDLIGNETDAYRGFGLLNTTRVSIHRG